MLRTGAALEVIPPPVLPKSLRSSNFSFLYFGYKNLLLQTFTIMCGTGFGFEMLKCFISFCGKERDKKRKFMLVRKALCTRLFS